MSQLKGSSNSPKKSQNLTTLEYYQQKVDELYKQRLAWLSKFDECASLVTDKQKKLQNLKSYKDKQIDINRAIVHHDIALLDERLNVIKIDRQNLMHQFADAEEILKIQELKEEFPVEFQKFVPCKNYFLSSQIINNELNIHCGKNVKLNENRKGYQKSKKEQHQKQSEIIQNNLKLKPTVEDILKKQLIELKSNQAKQLLVMDQQAQKLQNLIKNVKKRENEILKQERSTIEKLKTSNKEQEDRYRKLAEKYFEAKRNIQNERKDTVKENQKLKHTLGVLEGKINEEIRIYEKQNKAKQTLIIKKSEDYQEDYKARMRAKQRNLQALKDNYQKMQEVCIERISKLEATLNDAHFKLQQTEGKRQHLISELRSELSQLQKKVSEEKMEKAKIDFQMKEKMDQQKKKRERLLIKEQQERKSLEKGKLLAKAYKKTIKNSKKQGSKSKEKIIADKPNKRKQKQESDDSGSQQESMAMSDLQNIRNQINQLENKISGEDKRKK